MVLSKAERSRINKSNRRKGYQVEYDTVKLFKNIGWWARRLPTRQQRGEMAPVDGYFWDPFNQIFGFFQGKVRRDLLTTQEEQLLWQLSKKYNCNIILSWRDWGIKWEYLVQQVRLISQP